MKKIQILIFMVTLCFSCTTQEKTSFEVSGTYEFVSSDNERNAQKSGFAQIEETEDGLLLQFTESMNEENTPKYELKRKNPSEYYLMGFTNNVALELFFEKNGGLTMKNYDKNTSKLKETVTFSRLK